MKQQSLVLLVLCGVAVAVLWPTSYLASPQWDVVVVDDNGKPLSGIAVRLVYQNYSTEDRSHEITLMADDNGHVVFPPQRGSATLLKRVLYTARSASAGVHASFGQHAYVFAFGNGYEGSAVTGEYVIDWRGSPKAIESRIVARKQMNRYLPFTGGRGSLETRARAPAPHVESRVVTQPAVPRTVNVSPL